MAKVFLARSARDALARLDFLRADAVLDALDVLGRDPDAGYELRGRLKGLRSYRVGVYRIIYELRDGKTVRVVTIRHRGPTAVSRSEVCWGMGSRHRSTIEIDETVLRIVMERYGLNAATEAVDMALRHLAGQPMTLQEALAMEGANAIGSVPDDQAPPDSA